MTNLLQPVRWALWALPLCSSLAQAGVWDSTGTGGNWDDPAAWTLVIPTDTGGNNYPDNDESVNVLAGDTITRNNGTLNTGSGVNLIVDGTLDMGSNQLNMISGNIFVQVNSGGQFNSSVRMAILSSNSEIELNGGSITLSGANRGFESDQNSAVWDINSGTVDVLNVNTSARAALDLQGTWDQSGGTVTLNNADASRRAIEMAGGSGETSVMNLSGTASLTAQGIEVVSSAGSSSISVEGSSVAKVDFGHFYMADATYGDQLGTISFSLDNSGVTPIELGNNNPFQGVASATSPEERFADYYQINISALDFSDSMTLTEYTLFDFSGGTFDPSADLQGLLDFSGFGEFASVTDAVDGDNFTFQSGGGIQTIYYSFIKFDSSRVYLDIYRLQSIPEPSSLLLIGLGAVMLWRRVRERLAA